MENENEFELNGKKYVAIEEGKLDNCLGCAFYTDPDGCFFSPACSASFRTDKRSMVWKEVGK